jgi:hypothetical protein
MTGGSNPFLFCGPHLLLTQWQGAAITFMAADVNPIDDDVDDQVECT